LVCQQALCANHAALREDDLSSAGSIGSSIQSFSSSKAVKVLIFDFSMSLSLCDGRVAKNKYPWFIIFARH
jgi:hypothetical protein